MKPSDPFFKVSIDKKSGIVNGAENIILHTPPIMISWNLLSISDYKNDSRVVLRVYMIGSSNLLSPESPLTLLLDHKYYDVNHSFFVDSLFV